MGRGQARGGGGGAGGGAAAALWACGLASLGGVLAVVASRREGGLPGPREDHVAFVRGFFDTQIERVNEATATGSGGVGAAGGGRQNDPSPPP